MTESLTELPDRIRAANLKVYAAMTARFFEDITSEAEVAHDYQGRLVYELLQNADDAMAQSANRDDRVWFKLTDHELWVGNSGRTLTEGDIRGLTSTGAGTKAASASKRRASIGHKGMGFKSVLELTDRPEVYSRSCSFVMDGVRAIESVSAVLSEAGVATPARAPIMRFPWEITELPDEWIAEQGRGLNVLFRFPFKIGLKQDKLTALSETLANLPVTTILFLKHLEHVQVEIDTSARIESFHWALDRRRKDCKGGFAHTGGLKETGTYEVIVETKAPNEVEGKWRFILAHDADVEIGRHRGGLNQYAWEGVELSEVTVAALISGADTNIVPNAWRKFHVFLPTQEICPYPFLVNGAFATDLSRKEIPTVAESDDYNTFLLGHAARTFRDRLIPELSFQDKGPLDVLRLLDRDLGLRTTASGAAQAMHQKMVDTLAEYPLLPIDDTADASGAGPADKIALPEAVIPLLSAEDTLGSDIRNLLAATAKYESFRFPSVACCADSLARIAVDHGARVLRPAQLAAVLEQADRHKVRLEPHPSGKLEVDPLLAIVGRVWRSLTGPDLEEFNHAVREHALFPVAVSPTGEIQRIAVGKHIVFYPPRSLRADVPLGGLRFLLQDVCWGRLTPPERTSVLRESMPIWQALFVLREFKFPEVMRASVLPSLYLEGDQDTDQSEGHRDVQRSNLEDLEKLAAICQLSGPTPTPSSPLPYERLGSQRALFNLCRLPMPCLIGQATEIVWIPAYRAYFGREWIGSDSVEEILDSIAPQDRGGCRLDVPILIGPEHFKGLLEKYKGLREIANVDVTQAPAEDVSEEVSLDEDEDLALDEDENSRWMTFLTWLGVNRSLRPVHFHDAEEDAKGWLKTKDLNRSGGWAFQALGCLWDEYLAAVSERVARIPGAAQAVPYFYRLHDLEYLAAILSVAEADATSEIARRLYTHLASAWPQLQKFAETQVALVPEGKWPSSRTKPPRAYDEELHDVGDDLWLFRLKKQACCPTTHGPRRPDQTWIPSKEIERRFDRQGSSSRLLLPLLDVPSTAIEGKARGLSLALGLRDDLTASNFEISDAKAFLCKIADLFPHDVRPTAQQLRQFIRPAYQNLFELLSGAITKAAHQRTDLSDAPILVHDGHGHYKFVPAREALYARRSGQRELLGVSEPLWTFVLEARPAAESPLRALFRTSVLEDVLEWAPQPGEQALTIPDEEIFRSGLRSIAPYLLARLRSERADDVLGSRDATRLRRFIGGVVPCRDLTVRCQLQGQPLNISSSRSSFVRAEPFQAFVVWGENPWPPTNEEAEALATAITELLDVTYFEPLLTLLAHPGGRDRLLHLAGASGNLQTAREMMTDDLVGASDHDSDGDGSLVLRMTAATDLATSEVDEPARPWDVNISPPVPRTPLLRIADLTFDGIPILVPGLPSSSGVEDLVELDDGKHRPTLGQANLGRPGSGYGGGTDMNELDRLGMYIAMNFERIRMSADGLSCLVFDPSRPDESAMVFDVSTRVAVDDAIKNSARCKKAFELLANHGVSAVAPGFDILTLDDRGEDGIGRLIELKSSGHNARTQSMSANEWRTASIDALRSRYYLYLVGNLRADLPEAIPFVRGICNPFAALFGQEKSATSARRSVQINVLEFDEAEFLELTVLRHSERLIEA
jgi:hypothetical protein